MSTNEQAEQYHKWQQSIETEIREMIAAIFPNLPQNVKDAMSDACAETYFDMVECPGE